MDVFKENITDESWTNQLNTLFSSSLHGNLKSKIKGHIFCKIENDELKVTIEYKNVNYIYKCSDMFNNIYHGLTVDAVSKDILADYKKILDKIFFLNGGSRYAANGSIYTSET